jgi:hypothetical protein
MHKIGYNKNGFHWYRVCCKTDLRDSPEPVWNPGGITHAF